MTRMTRLFPALTLAALLIAPLGAQQNVDDLRRRIEAIEQQMFQQRLSQPVSPQGQAVQQLETRVRQLEMDIASERVSQTAATITSRRPVSPGEKSVEVRLDELEALRRADAKTIEALTKRIAALEKPRAK